MKLLARVTYFLTLVFVVVHSAAAVDSNSSVNDGHCGNSSGGLAPDVPCDEAAVEVDDQVLGASIVALGGDVVGLGGGGSGLGGGNSDLEAARRQDEDDEEDDDSAPENTAYLPPAPGDESEGGHEVGGLTVDTGASSPPLPPLLSPTPSKLIRERKELWNGLGGYDGKGFAWNQVVNSPCHGMGLTPDNRRFSHRTALGSIFEEVVIGGGEEVVIGGGVETTGTGEVNVSAANATSHNVNGVGSGSLCGDVVGLGGDVVGLGGDVVGLGGGGSGLGGGNGGLEAVRRQDEDDEEDDDSVLDTERDSEASGVGNVERCMRWIIFFVCPLVRSRGHGKGK